MYLASVCVCVSFKPKFTPSSDPVDFSFVIGWLHNKFPQTKVTDFHKAKGARQDPRVR